MSLIASASGALTRTWSSLVGATLSSPPVAGGIRRYITWLESRFGSASPAGDAPLVPRDPFPWAADLEANWKPIRAELDAVLENFDALPNFQDISPAQVKITQDGNWKTFFFYGYGRRFEPNCDRCPETAALLAGVPGLTTAFFSILGPDKHIPAHRGPYRGVVRYHLGLKVPEPGTECGIRVGDTVTHWREGEGFLFDDTYDHEAWNRTDGIRAVLFLDVVRPLSPPYSVLNDMIINLIAGSAEVTSAQSNLESWEEGYARLLGDRA